MRTELLPLIRVSFCPSRPPILRIASCHTMPYRSLARMAPVDTERSRDIIIDMFRRWAKKDHLENGAAATGGAIYGRKVKNKRKKSKSKSKRGEGKGIRSPWRRRGGGGADDEL